MHRFILRTRSLIMGSGCFEALSLGSLNKFFSVCTRVCSTTTTTYLPRARGRCSVRYHHNHHLDRRHRRRRRYDRSRRIHE